MKALLPVFCRPMGYAGMALALILPFIMAFMGRVTDSNLLFYKECSKLLMMMGALMIIFALTKHENAETVAIRNRAVRQAMFLTVLFTLKEAICISRKDTPKERSSLSFKKYIMQHKLPKIIII